MLSIIQGEKLAFEVERVNEPFTSSDGIICPTSVRVYFLDPKGNRSQSKTYGEANMPEIYKKISRGEQISLSDLYIRDFSLSAFRKLNELPKEKIIGFNNFEARQSFFDCESEMDFSQSRFSGKTTFFEKSVFGNGKVDFSNANFNENGASFFNVIFGYGRKIFNDVVFSGGRVDFNEAHFGDGGLSFVNTRFDNSQVSFEQAQFGNGPVDFQFSKFSGDSVSFDRAHFERGRKDFRAVEFGNGRVDFKRAIFGEGDVNFEGAEFGTGLVLFRHSIFGKGEKIFKLIDISKGHISFEGCEFGSGKVDFKHAKVKEIDFKDTQINSYFDLRFKTCETLDLSGTIVRDVINLKPENEFLKLKSLQISGMKLMGTLFISWAQSDLNSLILNQKKTTHRQKAEQFMVLKKNFADLGEFADEDLAYVSFKRCDAKAVLESSRKANSWRKFAALPSYWFKLMVFDKLGGYGTDPLKVLRGMGVFYILYSSLYYYLPLLSNSRLGYLEGPDHTASLATAYYFSIVSFFTIGYGDFQPVGFLRVLAGFEGFVGVFLMSYFTVAFARKILR